MADEEEREFYLWATSWTEDYEYDGQRTTGRRLVLVEAESSEAARRESGLIDHVFTEPTDDEEEEWTTLTEEPLSREDALALSRLLAKEQRTIARGRAKDHASEAGFTTRGIGGFVLTPEGFTELRRRGIAARGNDPGPLLDALVREGIRGTDATRSSRDHYRARKFAELQGKLLALVNDGEEE